MFDCGFKRKKRSIYQIRRCLYNNHHLKDKQHGMRDLFLNYRLASPAAHSILIHIVIVTVGVIIYLLKLTQRRAGIYGVRARSLKAIHLQY
jgi:hypothetical protein